MKVTVGRRSRLATWLWASRSPPANIWTSALSGAAGRARMRFEEYSPVTEACGTNAISCARTPCIAAKAPRALRTHPSLREVLRNDDDITGLEQHVLVEVASLHDLAVAELKGVLRVARPPKHHDVVRRRKGRHSACDAQCLQHADARIHREGAGLVHLADDIDLAAIQALDRYRDDGIRNV